MMINNLSWLGLAWCLIPPCLTLVPNPPSFSSLIQLSDKTLSPQLPIDPPPPPGPSQNPSHRCILYDYYDPSISSFNVNGVEASAGRLSVTSTIYSLMALVTMGTPLKSMAWTCIEVFESEWR